MPFTRHPSVSACHSPSLRGRGFTLTELLVVMVIIAALAVLGVTSIRNSLAAAKQSKCATNLRNLGVALQLHTQDHDGSYPETTHTQDLQESWVYTLREYLGHMDEVRICPADPKARERLEAKGTSYVLNSYLFVPETGPFGEPLGPALNKPSLLPDPARTLVAFICSDRLGTGPGNDHTHSSEWSSWSAVCRDISPDRFGGGNPEKTTGRSNYLYVDGRVESITAARLKQQIDSGTNVAKPPGIEGIP